jgi:hypothetical protein
MSIRGKLIFAVVLITVCGFSATAQSTVSSYYVSATGSDNNNGRSEDVPFKTLAKAMESAGKGSVKRITVLGTLNRASEGSRGDSIFSIGHTGTKEILICGKSETEKASLAGGTTGTAAFCIFPGGRSVLKI